MAEGEDQANEIADLAVEIYAIHDAVIEESGGLAGLREAHCYMLLRPALLLPSTAVIYTLVILIKQRLSSILSSKPPLYGWHKKLFNFVSM